MISILVGNDCQTSVFDIADRLGIGKRERDIQAAQCAGQDVCAGVVKREAKRGAVGVVKCGFSHVDPPFIRISGMAPIRSVPRERYFSYYK